MKSKITIRILIFLFLIIVPYSATFAQNQVKAVQKNESIKYKVTFVEQGSVRCIPCQKMQPVMKSVEEKYAGQVKVVFHDVWTPDGQPFAKKYDIQSIPTQVFLDENGKEYARHVGYSRNKNS